MLGKRKSLDCEKEENTPDEVKQLKLVNHCKLKAYIGERRGEREDMQDAHTIIDDFTFQFSALPNSMYVDVKISKPTIWTRLFPGVVALYHTARMTLVAHCKWCDSRCWCIPDFNLYCMQLWGRVDWNDILKLSMQLTSRILWSVWWTCWSQGIQVYSGASPHDHQRQTTKRYEVC